MSTHEENPERLRVRAERGHFLTKEIHLRFFRWSRDHRQLHIMQPAIFTALHPQEGEAVREFDAPALVMQVDEGQALMDELWQLGLRPSEGTGSAGSLAATQRHLEDMRALVFKTEKPGAR